MNTSIESGQLDVSQADYATTDKVTVIPHATSLDTLCHTTRFWRSSSLWGALAHSLGGDGCDLLCLHQNFCSRIPGPAIVLYKFH